jgi:chromosome segregation and condensation protein ScpB|tara:strand:- start:2 stop:244 length:243 start_codon:yes stop_codon:yes gene_type:complete
VLNLKENWKLERRPIGAGRAPIIVLTRKFKAQFNLENRKDTNGFQELTQKFVESLDQFKQTNLPSDLCSLSFKDGPFPRD